MKLAAPATTSTHARVHAQSAADLPSGVTTLRTERSNGGYVDTVAAAGSLLIGVRAIFGVGRDDSPDLDARNDEMRGRLPDHLVAVADAEGGTLVCLSARTAPCGSGTTSWS